MNNIRVYGRIRNILHKRASLNIKWIVGLDSEIDFEAAFSFIEKIYATDHNIVVGRNCIVKLDTETIVLVVKNN